MQQEIVLAINMKKMLFLLVILLIPIVCAEITFFDNPDDMFIYSNPASSASQAPSGGGGCSYKWNCTNWGECLSSGKQIRNCINIGTCSSTYKSPEIKQNCTYTAQKDGEEAKWPEKENAIEKEEEKPEETREIIWKGNVDKNRAFLYFITVLIIGFVIFYLKKDYFKKQIKRN